MLQDKFVLVDGTVLQSNIIGVDWTTSSNSDSDITPGSVCASAVEIEFWVSSDSALSVTQGTVLTYYKVDTEFGIETKLGVFTCDKPEKTGANKYKVTAYDNVTLLDVDVTEWLNALTFPITIKDFATALATKCELELANEPRLNKDYQIQKFTGSGVNARELMKMVCSASGCFCNADADGKLSFDWYKKNNKVVIAPRKSVNASSFYLFDVVPRSLQDNVPRALVTTESGNDAPDGIPYFANQLTFSDFTVKAIDKVQVKKSNDDVGVIYPADAQGTNALVIQGNQLLSATSDEALRPYVKNLYDGLNNITYVPCSNIQTPETLDIKVGDIVTVSDGKRQFETWITSVKHSGNRCTFESVGNANRSTTTVVNDTQYNARQKMAEIKTSIDRISTKLSEYSTTVQMQSAIEQSASAIKLEISGKYATQDELGGYTKTNEIRSKFAMDASSVTIDTGSLTFNSNSIVINSTNFKLDGYGNVTASGTFIAERGDYNITMGGYGIVLNYKGVEKGSIYFTNSGDTFIAVDSYYLGRYGNNKRILFVQDGKSYVSVDTASIGSITGLKSLTFTSSSGTVVATLTTDSYGNPTIRMTGKPIISGQNGSLVGYFDQMSIEGGAAQPVHWTYSKILGGWVLSTSSSLN